MSLPQKTRLGPYEIVALIGAGGMGEIYRAHDIRLSRDVAIKVLPWEFSADPGRRERFQVEARAVSALSNPYIATLHDIGHQDGTDYLVMEFVEGRTLADHLSHQPEAKGLESFKAARYGAQISDALAHAHGRNILHRDLKTSNVMITTDDRVKVLDFGLAKYIAGSETMTRVSAPLTEPGGIVGTVYALAPEILSGQAADVRSDIWSLGIILYEMAAGHQPFRGNTSAEVCSKILREDPPPLDEKTPVGFQDVIKRCLTKEPEKRFQNAVEVRAALEAMQSGPSPRVALAIRKSSKTIAVYASVAILVSAALIAALFLSRSRRLPSTVRYEQVTNFADSVASPALSPDGRMLAFIRGEGTFDGKGEIWAKLLPDGEPVQLTNDGSMKMGPTFSPDGSKIAYTRIQGWSWDTWTVPALHGIAQPWLPNASGLTWINSQQLLFSEIATGIYMKVVSSDQNRGGERDVYSPPNGEVGMAHRSFVSPDHNWVLVTEMDNKGWLPCRLVPFSGGAQTKTVGPAPSKCTGAGWSPDQKWMYVSADAGSGFHLWRQGFPGGPPEQLTFGATQEEGVAMAPDGKSLITAVGTEQCSIYLQQPGGLRQITSQGYTYSPSLSADGKQIYYLLRTNSSRAFVAGELRSVDLVTRHDESLFPGFSVTRYDVSADGKRVVFAALEADGKSSIWLASLARAFPPKRLTQPDTYRPFFVPGGKIVYLGKDGSRDYVYRMKDDGTEQERILADPVIYLIAVSPDGQQIVTWVERKQENSPSAILVYPTAGGKPAVLCAQCSATGPAYTGSGVVNWSPDQRFLYMRLTFPGMSTAGTFVIPLSAGRALPNLPLNGFQSAAEVRTITGAREIPEQDVFPGRDPARYTISRVTAQRNLYRIWLPD